MDFLLELDPFQNSNTLHHLLFLPNYLFMGLHNTGPSWTELVLGRPLPKRST